jgi:hypothetical protein
LLASLAVACIPALAGIPDAARVPLVPVVLNVDIADVPRIVGVPASAFLPVVADVFAVASVPADPGLLF